MKNVIRKISIFLFICAFGSCDEPDTTLTNIIHSDGSITRILEILSNDKRHDLSNIQVPLDSTWNFSDSLIISEKNDTTWYTKAEKLFTDFNAINETYDSDSSSNSQFRRYCSYSKKFRWFFDVYRYSETIKTNMLRGYPVSDFLNEDEQNWFYMPGEMCEKLITGPDSVYYHALKDSVDLKTEEWLLRSSVSEWIGIFSELVKGKEISNPDRFSDPELENEFYSIVKEYIEDFDSLWTSGEMLNRMIGEEDAANYRADADTALVRVTEIILATFNDYSVKCVMPGKLINTNGFSDSTGIVVWPVRSDFFMTRDYEMWAESRVPNKAGWIISGLFLLFVTAGLIIKMKKG